jgi:hypothetical protein
MLELELELLDPELELLEVELLLVDTLMIHKNRFVIFESSKRDSFESVNCVLNVKKI